MTAYNLFILDREDRIVTGLDFQCSSDNEAIQWASFVVDASKIGEVWCGTRRLGRAHDGHFQTVLPGIAPGNSQAKGVLGRGVLPGRQVRDGGARDFVSLAL